MDIRFHLDLPGPTERVLLLQSFAKEHNLHALSDKSFNLEEEMRKAAISSFEHASGRDLDKFCLGVQMKAHSSRKGVFSLSDWEEEVERHQKPLEEVKDEGKRK